MGSSKRFAIVVLALGTVVLLAAIAIGQLMGYRLLGQATELSPTVLPTVLITPEPSDAGSGTLSGAPDPVFPDPRVPPVPLPTRPPVPTPTPKPPGPTPNPNIPIWRQSPLPTATPSPAGSPEARAVASPGATTPPY